jgi:hypothetical protein
MGRDLHDIVPSTVIAGSAQRPTSVEAARANPRECDCPA